MRALPATLAAVAAALVLTPAAGAVPLVLTNGTTLVNVDTNNLASPSAPVTVSGLQAGEHLVGIDQRPSTGRLYGVGSANRLYLLNPLTGAAAAVGGPGGFLLGGTSFGTDFEPTFEGIRQVSNQEQNIRIKPNTGVWAPDFALDPPGDVVAAAYDNNVAGTTSTTLFDIDAASGMLLRQGDPGGAPFGPHRGDLHPIGSLGLGTNLDEDIGFDIGADGVALATVTTAGPLTKLYGINTGSGVATDLGTIGTGTTSYLGLAIMSTRIRLPRATVTGSEGGTAVFRITRSAPAGGAVTVGYSTAAGTATSGADFTPKSGTLSWGAGDSSTKTIAVPLRPDAVAEGAETFSLSLGDPSGLDNVRGAPAKATATIAASDRPPLLKLGGKSKQKLRSVRRRGVAVTVTVDRACGLDAALRRVGKSKRIGRVRRTLAVGKHTVRIKVRKKVRGKLRAKQRLRVSAVCSTGVGESATAGRTIKLKR